LYIKGAAITMDGILIHTDKGDYITCQAGSGLISTEQDILDLLAVGYGLQQTRMVIDSADLHPDFFNLKTGLLGNIFLKLSNYRVKTAFIVEMDKIKAERFHELIHEHKRSHEIRFFEDLRSAEEWLFQD
jgi:hypothetical protein